MWAAPAARYCPSRAGELLKQNMTKPHERWDGNSVPLIRGASFPKINSLILLLSRILNSPPITFNIFTFGLLVADRRGERNATLTSSKLGKTSASPRGTCTRRRRLQGLFVHRYTRRQLFTTFFSIFFRRCPDPVSSKIRPDSNFGCVSETLDEVIENYVNEKKNGRGFNEVAFRDMVRRNLIINYSCPRLKGPRVFPMKIDLTSRLVNGHRPGRLVDLEIMANSKIMVDRLQFHNRRFKMTHIEAKSINSWLR